MDQCVPSVSIVQYKDDVIVHAVDYLRLGANDLLEFCGGIHLADHECDSVFHALVYFNFLVSAYPLPIAGIIRCPSVFIKTPL